MKKLLLVSAFFFAVYFLQAQERQWSVEANYPLNLTNGAGVGELNGVLDIGLKYRFKYVGPVSLGVGINTSFLKNHDNFTYGSGEGQAEFDYKRKNVWIQPTIFGEMAIPGIQKLKPWLGLGYSIVADDLNYKDGDRVDHDNTISDGGFNFNIGVSYDLTEKFFISLQYDYLNIRRKGVSDFEGQSLEYDYNEDASIIKAGVGFRF